MTTVSLPNERPEAPLFCDGLGERVVAADGATGELLQILRIRPALTAVPSFEFALRERAALQDAWKQMGLQLQLATDQHAAMTQELEDLAASDPESFSQDQIWILIRAIKVQSQVLQMYVGHPWLDV